MKLTGESRSFGSAFSALLSQIETSSSGCVKRQRPQQHGVDDAEDRGGGAGAEAEGEDGDGGERGGAAPLAPGEAHVAGQAGRARAPTAGR